MTGVERQFAVQLLLPTELCCQRNSLDNFSRQLVLHLSLTHFSRLKVLQVFLSYILYLVMPVSGFLEFSLLLASLPLGRSCYCTFISTLV